MGYTWVNKGLASGLSFTMGNYVYKYNGLTNTLEPQTGGSNETRKKDLLFVLRDLQNIEIENNAFKIYVNHYRLK